MRGKECYKAFHFPSLSKHTFIRTYTNCLSFPNARGQVAAGYPFVLGDVRWTPSNTVKFPVACILAGMFAGLSGERESRAFAFSSDKQTSKCWLI